MFARNGTAWSQRAYVTASNTGTYDRFDASLALSADGSPPNSHLGRIASTATAASGSAAGRSVSPARSVRTSA